MTDVEIKKKQADIIELSKKFLNAIDPSGVNAKKYTEFFSNMSPKQFESFMKLYIEEQDEYLPLDFCEFDRELIYENIEKGLNVLNVPFFETVFMPWLTNDDSIDATPEPVPVGYLHIKRPQQTVFKKNGMSISVDKRSALTNQTTGKDKNGRSSDMENISLVAIGGLDNTLKELNGFRADDAAAYQAALVSIYTDGTVSLKDLPDDVSNKVTLNTVNEYLLCMGIKTDLIDKGLMFRKNIT